MAASETMAVTRDIDDMVKGVDKRLVGVDERVHCIDMKTEGIEDKVQGVDNRVGSVIRGESFFPLLALEPVLTPTPSGVKEAGEAIEQVFNQVNNINRKSSSKFFAADPKTSNSRTENELRKDLRKWIAPPDPSVNFNTASDVHHEGTAAWCTKGVTVVTWKESGSLLWIHGKRKYSFTPWA